MIENVNWMIYGAYGYTGRLLVKEAIKKGYRPIIAGRNEKKLQKFGKKCNLKHRAFSLGDLENSDLREKVFKGVSLVLHAAGPFSSTAKPMVNACLLEG